MSFSRFPLLHEWSLWKLLSFVALSYYNIDVSLSEKKVDSVVTKALILVWVRKKVGSINRSASWQPSFITCTKKFTLGHCKQLWQKSVWTFSKLYFYFRYHLAYRPNAISLQYYVVKDNTKFNTDAISIADHAHRCWHCTVMVSKVFILHALVLI